MPKIILTVSEELKKEIRSKAGLQDKSMNTYILDCIKLSSWCLKCGGSPHINKVCVCHITEEPNESKTLKITDGDLNYKNIIKDKKVYGYSKEQSMR